MAHFVLSAEGQRLGHGKILRPYGSTTIWYFPYMWNPNINPNLLSPHYWDPPSRYPQFWETLIYETEICIVKGPPPCNGPANAARALCETGAEKAHFHCRGRHIPLSWGSRLPEYHLKCEMIQKAGTSLGLILVLGASSSNNEKYREYNASSYC